MKLGISGPPGSGKDTIADYLTGNYGYTHISTSNLLRAEATRRGLNHDRSTLQQLGTELRSQYGYDKVFADSIERTRSEAKAVFTGIRTVDAAQLFISLGGALLYVDAPIEIRYERCLERERESVGTFEQFAAADRIEHEGSVNADMSLNRIRALAHFVIENSDTTEDLHIKVDELIADPLLHL